MKSNVCKTFWHTLYKDRVTTSQHSKGHHLFLIWPFEHKMMSATAYKFCSYPRNLMIYDIGYLLVIWNSFRLLKVDFWIYGTLLTVGKHNLCQDYPCLNFEIEFLWSWSSFLLLLDHFQSSKITSRKWKWWMEEGQGEKEGRWKLFLPFFISAPFFKSILFENQ